MLSTNIPTYRASLQPDRHTNEFLFFLQYIQFITFMHISLLFSARLRHKTRLLPFCSFRAPAFR